MGTARAQHVFEGLGARVAAHLASCGASHDRVCPRQVLGVRIGIAGCAAVGADVHVENKRLLVIAEADGCFVSGLEAATGCRVGHRTLRVEDIGRIAAVFVDSRTERAFRVFPQPGVRDRVGAWAPGVRSRYDRMLRAYQVMPDEDLLGIESVRLSPPASVLVSRPHVRVTCVACGEEVINEREVEADGGPRCRVCAGHAYYERLPDPPSVAPDR